MLSTIGPDAYATFPPSVAQRASPWALQNNELTCAGAPVSVEGALGFATFSDGEWDEGERLVAFARRQDDVSKALGSSSPSENRHKIVTKLLQSP
jgi:hypothetical protein